MAFDGIEIGALWPSKGKALFVGKLGNARVIVLENRSDNEKAPTAKIFVVPDNKDEQRGGGGDRNRGRDRDSDDGGYGGYGGNH